MTEIDDVRPPLRRPTEAPALYAQESHDGYAAIVFAHYFIGGHDWLVTEYDPEQDLGFGWACLGGDRQNAELGYMSLAELASIRAPVRADLVNGPGMILIGYATVEYDEPWPPGLSIRAGIARLDERSGR